MCYLIFSSNSRQIKFINDCLPPRTMNLPILGCPKYFVNKIELNVSGIDSATCNASSPLATTQFLRPHGLVTNKYYQSLKRDPKVRKNQVRILLLKLTKLLVPPSPPFGCMPTRCRTPHCFLLLLPISPAATAP